VQIATALGLDDLNAVPVHEHVNGDGLDAYRRIEGESGPHAPSLAGVERGGERRSGVQAFFIACEAESERLHLFVAFLSRVLATCERASTGHRSH
jgi:hypothetical protein